MEEWKNSRRMEEEKQTRGGIEAVVVCVGDEGEGWG